MCALFRDTFFDRATATVTLAVISFPDFFVAYTLVLFLSIKSGLFPSIANVSEGVPLATRIYGSFLPALTLMLFVTTHMMRMTRAAIIDVLSKPFIEMAQLKGLSPLSVILRHALPNAWAPIINVIVFNLAYLILGVIVVEVVFAYPGLGQLLVDSVSKRDIPVVQACCLIFGSTFILLNLAADILGILANPRLRRRK
jgi:peptide/nickel transport system permease protein